MSKLDLSHNATLERIDRKKPLLRVTIASQPYFVHSCVRLGAYMSWIHIRILQLVDQNSLRWITTSPARLVMKRSCGSAGRPADDLEDTNATLPAHVASDAEDIMATLAAHTLSRSAERPAPPVKTVQAADELSQAIGTQTEEQGDNFAAALVAAYELGRASMTTDNENRKSACAKIRMPYKTEVLDMLWTAANNGTVAALDEKQERGTTAHTVAATNLSKATATDDHFKPSIDAIAEGAECILPNLDGTDDTTPAYSAEAYVASVDRYKLLSVVRLRYTPMELDLIADSHTRDGDGNPKRALVRDIKGRCYTMPSMSRCVGDFTVHADFLLSKFQEPDFNPLWIRQPDSCDPPESILVWTPESSPKEMTPIDERVCRFQNQYVVEMRKGELRHTNGKPIRSNDTMGMFPSGMTLRLLTTSQKDTGKEKELVA